MFDKIYEYLHLVKSVYPTDDEKQKFEHKCQEISAKGYGIAEVIDIVYSYLRCNYTLEEATELTDFSYLLQRAGKIISEDVK